MMDSVEGDDGFGGRCKQIQRKVMMDSVKGDEKYINCTVYMSFSNRYTMYILKWHEVIYGRV